MLNENELYARWCNTVPKERVMIEKQLHSAVRTHVRAVVMKKFPEARIELPDDITDIIILNLRLFRQQCKFSTWVHAIAKTMTNGALRDLIRSRNLFDRRKFVPGVDDEEAEHSRNKAYPHIYPAYDNRIAVRELFPPLPNDQRKLLRFKLREVPAAQIAKRMRITQEAVDSRWARLKPKLKKMLVNATV